MRSPPSSTPAQSGTSPHSALPAGGHVSRSARAADRSRGGSHTRVAPDGSVLATDIDPRHLSTAGSPTCGSNATMLAPEALPSSAFDLVHARLVLMHIQDDAAALQRMIDAVKPGGWLLVEDFSLPFESAHAPLPSLLAIRRLMAAAGVDLDGGHTLASRFRASGLENVDTEARAYMWYGRSAGSKVFRANIEQLRAGDRTRRARQPGGGHGRPRAPRRSALCPALAGHVGGMGTQTGMTVLPSPLSAAPYEQVATNGRRRTWVAGMTRWTTLRR